MMKKLINIEKVAVNQSEQVSIILVGIVITEGIVRTVVRTV